MTRKKTIVALILPVAALAGGCNSGDDGSAPVAVINAENTISYGKEATTGLNDMVSAGDDLSHAMSQFAAMPMGKSGPGMTAKLAASGTEETIECWGGGTVNVQYDQPSTMEQVIHLSADQCVDESGTAVHGELDVVISPWDEFPNSADSSAIEMIMETGAAGLAVDDCGFNGGLVMRIHAAMDSNDPNGANTFVFEHGTTDDGFISFCKPDQLTSIAANTLVRNEFTYAYGEGGSSKVSIQGGFEAPDGSGFVTVLAENLEYDVNGYGTNSFGRASCPSGGQITITGANDSMASFYFGDDAPAGYEVQVTGPDGFVAEFETCEAFLAAGE